MDPSASSGRAPHQMRVETAAVCDDMTRQGRIVHRAMSFIDASCGGHPSG
jgi:hypothetical protein